MGFDMIRAEGGGDEVEEGEAESHPEPPDVKQTTENKGHKNQEESIPESREEEGGTEDNGQPDIKFGGFPRLLAGQRGDGGKVTAKRTEQAQDLFRDAAGGAVCGTPARLRRVTNAVGFQTGC